MIFGVPEWLLLVATIFSLVIVYGWRINQFYKKRRINYLKPNLFVGNMLNVLLGKEHAMDVLRKSHEKFPNNRYVGVFNFTQPIIVVKDIELLRKIFVKDFDHFSDHMQFTDESVDPLNGRSLVALTGERWREMRSTLSPAFTGSKMRGMLPFIIECAKNMTNHVGEEVDEAKSKGIGYAAYDMKEFTGRYSTDVIATCAFGIKVDSFNEKKNAFYTLTKQASTITTIMTLKVFIYFLSPALFKFLKLDLSEKDSADYFRKTIMENMAMREEQKLVRNDMIHLLMQAKKGTLEAEEDSKTDDAGFATIQEASISKTRKTQWIDDDLVAQALIFVFAGYDTISTTLSFLFYELTVNPDIQQKLYSEIEEQMSNSDGNIDYTDLGKYKYLDMVVSETLRLWPSALFLDRLCVRPYELPAQHERNGTKHVMEKGEGLWIPVYEIHRNPEYYENPDKFDPERFSDENKSKIDPFTYLPFGIGPRACIGSRFALMEIKLLTVILLNKFELVPTSNTSKTMKLKNSFFETLPEEKINVGFKRRVVMKY